MLMPDAGSRDARTTPSADVPADVPFRRCAMCSVWKGRADFHNSRTGQFSYCRDCRRKYDRRYYRERGRSARRQRQRARNARVRAWMAQLKRDVPCADCAKVFPTPVMHWDHLPGHAKVGNISALAIERSGKLMLEELKKCELVCANCHAIRTSQRATGRSSAR